MICLGCDNKKAYRILSVYEKGERSDFCDRCGNLPAAFVPDAYVGKTTKFSNLCDTMGRPYEITSKRHKKEVMDRLGVSEAGGTVNGAPYGTKSWIEGTRARRKKGFEKDRPMIRETLKKYLSNVKKKS